MNVIEIILLIIAYSVIIMALFLEYVCYKRNMETLETIFLTLSLLLLIISISSSYLTTDTSNIKFTNVFIQLAMTVVGLATILNTLEERKHTISNRIKLFSTIISSILLITIIIGHFHSFLNTLQYVVVVFLAISVLASMLLVRFTQPVTRIAHRERVERIMSIVLMVVIPGSLLLNYFLQNNNYVPQIGFTIPLVFIVLASSKVWDDMKRLSLVNKAIETNEQSYTNYGFTAREKEVAELLIKGVTYVQISEQLFISLPTVKTHVSNIYRKCKISNKTELIVLLSR